MHSRYVAWLTQEFLLFLLPLVKPQRLLRRLARIPTHPAVLAALHGALPQGISKRIGLEHDEKAGRVRLGGRRDRPAYGRYYNLPEECCAICFERLEKAAGVDVDVRAPAPPPPAPPHVAIPSIDPLHPSKGLVARRRNREKDGEEEPPESSAAAQRAAVRAAKLAERRAARRAQGAQPQETSRPSLLAASPNGIKYLDALATTPYQTLPCAEKGNGCIYCYYCIAEKLISESTDDDLQDQGGWECLRCAERVYGAERVPAVADS